MKKPVLGSQFIAPDKAFFFFFFQSKSLNPSPAEPGYILSANSVDPDQLASQEGNWSGSALFAIKYMYVNLYQQSESSNLMAEN